MVRNVKYKQHNEIEDSRVKHIRMQPIKINYDTVGDDGKWHYADSSYDLLAGLLICSRAGLSPLPIAGRKG